MVHMIALARKLQPNHEWESERNKGDDRVDKIKDSLLKKGFVFSEPKQIECGRKDNFINTHNVKWHDPKVEISEKPNKGDKAKTQKPKASKVERDKENSYRKSFYDWNKLKKNKKQVETK